MFLAATTLQLAVNLYQDSGGAPGALIADDTVTVGQSFFAEIVAGDIRSNPAGVIGLPLDIDWSPATFEEIDSPFNPADVASPLVTANFPMMRGGTLDNATGIIDELSGGSLPNFGIGQAIGVGATEQFGLLHFQAEAATSGFVPFHVTIGSSGVSFADGAASYDQSIEAQTIRVLPPILPGDYDGNHAVEEADYDFWKANFGATSGPGLAADGSGNGTVDAADYCVWRDNYHPAPSLPGDYDGNHAVEEADYDFWKANFGVTSGPGLAADGNGNGIVDAADYCVWRDSFEAGTGAGTIVAETESPVANGSVTCSPLSTQPDEVVQDAEVVPPVAAASEPAGGTPITFLAMPGNGTARSAIARPVALHDSARLDDAVIQAWHRDMALLRLTRDYIRGRTDVEAVTWHYQRDDKPDDQAETVDAALAEIGQEDGSSGLSEGDSLFAPRARRRGNVR